MVLADEPTANLDVQTGSQILDIFRELARRENRAVVIVTHDAKVRRIADRVCSIQDGRLTEQHHDVPPPLEPVEPAGGRIEPARRLGFAIPNGRAFHRSAADVPTPNGRRSISLSSAFSNGIALKTPAVNGEAPALAPIPPPPPAPAPKPPERPKPAALPDPWCSTVIGSPALKGSASSSNGTFFLEASGADDKAGGDHCHTVDRMHKGDATIVARSNCPGRTRLRPA